MRIFAFGIFLALGLVFTAQAPAHAEIPLAGGDTKHITAEQAIALAVNNLEETAAGYHLSHPRYAAEFTAEGIRFRPRGADPQWSWRLDSFGAAVAQPVRPVLAEPGLIRYQRGVVTEEYVVKPGSTEQRFLIAEPLELGGKDLVLVGSVECNGRLEKTEPGWAWRGDRGEVRLGEVRVFDATGATLPATFVVAQYETRLTLSAAALAGAVYPVTIDPEIGANDFLISSMGPVGNPDYDAFDPVVAYNSTDDEYLVVWEGDHDRGTLLDGEFEIYGQLLDAVGNTIGSDDFRISDMGGAGNIVYQARQPAVAYNSTDNEYLVVWSGDHDRGDLADNEHEVFGQLLDADGGGVGANDFRISDMGGTGDPRYDTGHPAVAYNSTDNKYLVVWEGDDDIDDLIDDEFEIFGQLLDADGGGVGANDFRISDMGDAGSTVYSAWKPAVAYNSRYNEYVVVWVGDDNTDGLVDQEFEVYGQILDADGGGVGANDFRISDMGGTGNIVYQGGEPAVAFNSTDNEYLVVWRGDDDTGGLVDNEYEVFGQILDADGGGVGANDFRISDAGGSGSVDYWALRPAVAYNSADNEYLVVWFGDDNTGGLVDNEYEVFGQLLDADGGGVGANDFRISDMGGTGYPDYDASQPALAHNSTDIEYLVVWRGDDDTGGLVDEEFEIFGQRLGLFPVFFDGFESGDTSHWSATVP